MKIKIYILLAVSLTAIVGCSPTTRLNRKTDQAWVNFYGDGYNPYDTYLYYNTPWGLIINSVN